MGDWYWTDEDGWCWTEDEPTQRPPVTEPISIDVPDELWPIPTAGDPVPATAALPAADVLTTHGIIRGPEVVELAAAAGLELAAAATLLMKESGGGRNVWGSDPVQTGGLYVKGAAVTQAAYTSYKAYRSRLGYQGVGPTQLTYGPLQDMADRIGGCWDWRANVKIGFGLLAGYIKGNGLRTGFRMFNGSGPAAERYADDAIARYARWQALLAGTTTQGEDMAAVPQDQWNNLYQQICGLFQAWGGGFTDDKGTPYDLLQFMLRTNVQLTQLGNDVAALKKAGDVAPAQPALTEADVSAVASSIVDQLVTTLSANRKVPG